MRTESGDLAGTAHPQLPGSVLWWGDSWVTAWVSEETEPQEGPQVPPTGSLGSEHALPLLPPRKPTTSLALGPQGSAQCLQRPGWGGPPKPG